MNAKAKSKCASGAILERKNKMKYKYKTDAVICFFIFEIWTVKMRNF